MNHLGTRSARYAALASALAVVGLLANLMPGGLVSAATTSDIASHFNSVLVSPDSNRGCGGVNSTYLSAEALAAANPQIVPGGTITTGGFSFSWPAVANCVNDSVRAAGQTITVGLQHGATALGLLGTGVGGAVADSVTVNYTDGSTAQPAVAFGDWCQTATTTNDTVVASMPYRNDAGNQQNINCYLFLDTIQGLDPSRDVASITLPTNTMMRIFAIALNGTPVTGNDAAPATPTGLGATPGSGRVDLSWTASGDGDVVGYNVYRDSVGSGATATLVGAGDIVGCDNGVPQADAAATANLVEGVLNADGAARAFTLGDDAYENGSASEFANCYDPTWGVFKAKTYPAVGNHEYQTANASGYYNYFGAAAGDPTKGYYSYDFGTWHVVVLNSNCGNVSCSTGSAQELWLRNDLATHPNACTLAYWHHPRFDSGSHGNDADVQALWQALYDYNADLILNGHDHLYERFAPQTPAGLADPVRGIPEFIVGTGGHSFHPFISTQPNSLVRNGDTFGVIKLELSPGSYTYQFLPVPGHTFTDTGTGACHDANGPVTAAVPLNGNTPVASPAYADTAVTAGTTYHYRVSAVDATGHESPLTTAVNAVPLAPTTPTISSLSPSSAKPGDMVTINGSGFGATQTTGTCLHITDANQGSGTTSWGIFGNGSTLAVNSWTDTAISFTVPMPSGANERWRIRPGTTATVAVHTGGGCLGQAGAGGADITSKPLTIPNTSRISDYFGDDTKMPAAVSPAVAISGDSQAACGTGQGAYLSSAALANGLTVTGATYSGGTATLTLDGGTAAATALAAGSMITVAGVLPAGFNGTFAVSSSTTSSVSYAVASDPGTFVANSGGTVTYTIPITGASWSGGNATLSYADTKFFPSSATQTASDNVSDGYVVISGINPSGYNGTFRITSHTATSLTYAVANPGSYVSGGTALDGIWPGKTVTSGGFTFSWPSPPACYSDNFNPDLWGPTLLMDPKIGADKLGILGTGIGNTTQLAITINYVGGTSLAKNLDLADWCAGSGANQTVVARMKYRNTNIGSNDQGSNCAYLYLDTITGLDTSKVVQSITFPTTGTNAGNVRIFAVALNGTPASTTTITSSQNPSMHGLGVTFTATVTGASGTPTGTVDFEDGATVICDDVPLNGSGQASCGPLPSLSTADHSITAAYSGDSTYYPSASPILTQTVNKAEAGASVASDHNPSTQGDGVTFTATVSSGGGTPTGTADFQSDGVDIAGCGSVSLIAGQATCGPITNLSVGNRTINVIYSGDANFSGDTSDDLTQIVQSVGAAATTTAVVSDDSSSVRGQGVTFTATVTTGSGTPTGTVDFKEGSTVRCSGTLSGGQATCGPLNDLTIGDHTITAYYSGDPNYLASTSDPITQTVGKADTTTTITGVTPDNATVVGQSYTVFWSVTPTPPGAGTPTGDVTVSGGSGCTAAASAGHCAVTSTDPGTKSLVATYAGDSNFNGSASSPATSHVVNKADSATTITGISLGSATVVGQSYTVSWSVLATSPGVGTPTGTVTISGDVGCSASVSAGQCSFAATSPGTKSLIATYGGDANFNGSASTPATSHDVNKADTTTTITSDLSTHTVVGQSYTVSWSVIATAPGAGTPTGTVTVSGGSGCTVNVTAGQCDVTSTTAGPKSLVATYNGDTNFNGSASSGTSHTVDKADTTTTITGVSLGTATVVGQSYTVSWSVVAAGAGVGTPTGTVMISGDVGCSASVAAGQCSFAATSPGTKSLVATYAGDTNFNGSASTPATSHVVNQAATTITISNTASLNSNATVVGQAYTVTWQVLVTSPGGGTPTGNVTVSDGSASCFAAMAVGQCDLTSTTAGDKTIVASYAGDTNFLLSVSSGAPHHVNGVTQVNTTTTLTQPPGTAPSVWGQSVTFTATVAGGATPTGTVQFKFDGVNLGSPVALSGGQASISLGTTQLTIKASPGHTIGAVYSGDSTHNGSTAVVLHQIVKKAATTAVVSSDHNPATHGTTVHLTATIAVVLPGGGIATGKVVLKVNGVKVGSATLGASGTVTFTISKPKGTYKIVVVYKGDTHYLAKTSTVFSQVFN